jgi:hypothetical protein
MKAVELAVSQKSCWRNITITLKIPRLGNQSVSYMWSLAKIVRKVEFKLLHMMRSTSGLNPVPPMTIPISQMR